MAITNAEFKSSQQDLTNWLVIVWWFQPLFICSLWSKLHELPAMPSCDWLSSPFWCSRWHAEIKIGGVMVYVHSFRTTIHSSDGCFQQKKAPCNKHKSNWLLEHVSECTVTRSQSNRSTLWNMVELESHIKDMQQKIYQVWYKKNPERDLFFTVTKHSEAENQRKVTERNYWEFFFFMFFGCLSRLHFHGNSLPEIWLS